jgi:hypothetical protein
MSISTYPSREMSLTVPLTLVNGGTGATTAPEARTNLGLGTLAAQDASAVAITGGSATGLTAPMSISGQAYNAVSLQTSGLLRPSGVSIIDYAGDNAVGLYCGLQAGGGAARHSILTGTAPSVLGGNLQVDGSIGLGIAASGHRLHILYSRAALHGIIIQPTADSGPGAAAYFMNAAQGQVGSITTTASLTNFNTSSDVRLKHAIATLTGALDRIHALRPVSFRWNADDSEGRGFLAHELQEHVPEAVSGEPDAVDAQGNIAPQGVDHSKIVPHLVAAVQELAAQVQALQAQVTALQGGTL